MSRKFGRLSPLTSLEGFEAAARLGSFTLAAEELCVTQSAISRQIRSLEEYFGVPLFRREGRKVVLTGPGDEFMEAVSQSLSILMGAQRRIQLYTSPDTVVIGATAAFASKWLLPRYSSLRSACPDLRPWMFTSDEHADLDASEVDLAIWYGNGQWAGVRSVKMFHDQLTPLYARDKLANAESIAVPEDLISFPLIRDEQLLSNWISWFQAVKIDDPNISVAYDFSDQGLVLDCAVDGFGVALGSRILAAGLLDDGRLIQPFSTCVDTHDAYYLVSKKQGHSNDRVARMYDWLMSEIALFADKAEIETDCS